MENLCDSTVGLNQGLKKLLFKVLKKDHGCDLEVLLFVGEFLCEQHSPPILHTISCVSTPQTPTFHAQFHCSGLLGICTTTTMQMTMFTTHTHTHTQPIGGETTCAKTSSEVHMVPETNLE